MLNFYDYEVFKYDWLVVIVNPIEKTSTVIINDKHLLEEYHQKHRDQIWIGYNSSGYDKYIHKGILCGFNPKEINDHIILHDQPGWRFSPLLQKVQLYNYDIGSRFQSLKQMEGFMGNDIEETSVPFDIDRPLTPEEIRLTLKYCRHDVYQTMEVFKHRRAEFDSQLALIKQFNLPLSYLDKTQAQLAAVILGAKRKDLDDEWDIRLPHNVKLGRYWHVGEWFLNPANHSYDSKLVCNIAGVKTTLAWGGGHSAMDNYIHECAPDELMLMIDVGQLYPNLMILYDLISRTVTKPEQLKFILSESMRLKALKMKKEREPFKRVCNIVYGAMGDPTNPMYDPLHRNLVCVFGQVLIVDLIDKIEDFCTIIQNNTDGLMLKLKRADFERLDDAVWEWEQRTGLGMEFDYFKKVIQKDVNNYIIVSADGEMKTKGAYVKKLSPIDHDLPIVNKALIDYMVNNVPVEQTINCCDDLMQFQKIVKISNKYLYGWHRGQRLKLKVFRVFASNDPDDTIIGKVKTKGGKPEKFANTPEKCFLDNGHVNGKAIPEKLDRGWYIALAKERLKQFGVI